MKVLEEYLNYIEKNKKLSKNTVASYNRDLKKICRVLKWKKYKSFRCSWKWYNKLFDWTWKRRYISSINF